MRSNGQEKHGNTGVQNPLAAPQPQVTRFNRRVVIGLAVVACSVLAFALLAAFAPKQKTAGKESATADKTKDAICPQPPDPLLNAPGKYSDLRNAGAATGAPGCAGPAAPGSGGLPQGDAPSYGVYPAPVNGGDPVSAGDQRAKDAASALNSPVTFNNGDSPQHRPEPPSVNGAPLSTLLPSVAEMRAASAGLTFPDDQNMQGEKRAFAGERGNDFPYIKATLLSPLSPYELKAGTILPALLMTGINSDLPGQLVAQLRENVYDTVSGNHLLMPQGSRIIGEYDSKIAFGQERTLVVWTRVVFPNGNSISLEGMPGIDLSGYAGVTGRVNNHYGKLVTSVVLGSVIGAGAQVAVGGQGAPNVPPSFGQLAVSGAAGSINQAAQQHVSKVLNLQPTIEVAPGDKINVFVTKDVILRPYTE